MYNPDARFLLSECLTSEIVFGLKQFEFKKKLEKTSTQIQNCGELLYVFVSLFV